MFLSKAAFLPYAFVYWIKHASDLQEGQWHKNSALFEAMKSFALCQRLPCVACDGHHQYSLFSNRRLDGTAVGKSPRLDSHTPFQLAICAGVIPLLRVLPFDDLPTSLSGQTSLHLALKHGQEAVSQFLIQTFPTLDVNGQDFSGRSGLHLAIRRADSSTVRLLLNHPSTNVNARDVTEATPLWEAVCVGEQPILASLLEHPLIDVNVGRGERKSVPKQDDLAVELAQTDKYARGITPLIFAVLSNKVPIVSTLLRHPTIDPNLCDSDGVSPLVAALGSGSGPEWKAFKPSSPASTSPLFDRSVNGSAQMVELVLCHPSTDVNMGYHEGLAPLMLASAAGRSDLVEVLVSHRNIDVNACSQQYETALSWLGEADRELSTAIQNDEAEPSLKRYKPGILAVQRILSHPQLDPDLICDSEGRTPLMLASMLGFDSLVPTLLLQPRKSPSSWTATTSISSFLSGIASVFQITPPSDSLQQDFLPPRGHKPSWPKLPGPRYADLKFAENHTSLRLRNSRSERVNQVDAQGRSPAMLALSPLNNNARRTIEVLLSNPSINVNQQDIDGDTVLIIASRRNKVTVARALLSRNDIDVNLCNVRGTNALMAAAASQRGDPAEAVGLLLQDPRIRNVNKPDAGGNSALHLALSSAARHSVSPRISASLKLTSSNLVDINLRDNMGDTPLHIASYHGVPDVAAALLRRPEVQVNLPSRHGSAPIHIACERKHCGIVRSLLQHKDTDVNSPNANGNAPIHIAAQSGDEDMMFALLQHPSTNVNCTNRHGYAAIHIAARLAADNAAVMQALLKHPGIDVNMRDSEGYTAVDVLVKFPNTAALMMLLRHPSLERHPLHHHRSFYSACWRQIYSGRPATSRQAKIDRRRIQAFLLYDPECIHFTDTAGKTVLHHAAKQECHELVDLIVHGAWDVWDDIDFRLRDLEGRTALDYAFETGNASIQWLLQMPPFQLASMFS